MDAWRTFYSDVWVPALRAAMDAGLINGWAVEEHASGGPMNWQIVYLLPSWDAIDDMWAMMFARSRRTPRATRPRSARSARTTTTSGRR